MFYFKSVLGRIIWKSLMHCTALASLLLLIFGPTAVAQTESNSLKLVDTDYPESFTEGELDTVSFTFNMAIDTTASYPNMGPLGFWRIIPVDSAEIDSIWVSDDLKTVSYRVEHKSRSDYTWLLENARSRDSTYLQRPYRLFYKLRSGEVNRFSVSGTAVLMAQLKRKSEFEDANQKESYIYHFVAFSTQKPPEESSKAYDPDSVKYIQHIHEHAEYEIGEVTTGTYWPVLLRRHAYNEDNWVKYTSFLAPYDPDNDDGADSIVVKENDLNNIDIHYEVDTSIEDENERIESFEIEAYPNPFNHTTNIEVTVARTGRYSVFVYDVTGRRIKTIASKTQLSRGIHHFRLDMVGLATGIYMVVVESSTSRLAKQISYIK